MAITKLNSLAIPPDTVVESDISFPLDSASFTGNLTVDTDTLIVDATNNRVGVGTAAPDRAVQVEGDADSTSSISLNRTGALARETRIGSNYVGTFSDSDFIVYANSSPTITAKNNGNVGIGTSSSGGGNSYLASNNTMLKVKGNSANKVGSLQLQSFGTANNSIFEVAALDSSQGVAMGTMTDGSLSLQTNNSTRMFITNSGNVGIGTPSSGPDTMLHLYRSVGDTILTIEADADNNVEGESPQIHFLTDGGLRTGAITGGNATNEGATGNFNALNLQGQTIRFLTSANQDFNNATQKMAILSTGHVSINNGNLIIGTSGKGIDFSADGNVSGMTSELLDDYEEGTFTCILKDDSGNTAGTGQSQYTKIGDIVHVIFNLPNVSTSGLNTNENIRMSVPFLSSVGSFGSVKLDRITFNTNGFVICRIPSSSAAVRLNQVANNAYDLDLKVSAINVAGGSDINGQITYKAT